MYRSEARQRLLDALAAALLRGGEAAALAYLADRANDGLLVLAGVANLSDPYQLSNREVLGRLTGGL